jgi:hypothetical protein
MDNSKGEGEYHFSPEEVSVATPEFDPFERYQDDNVKFVHISKAQLMALAEEAHIMLPPIDQDELILWGPMAQKHSEIISKNFGINFHIAEQKGRYINAGIAIAMPEKEELVVMGSSGDLHNSTGKPFFSMLRSQDGITTKRKENNRTIKLLEEIYGEIYGKYSEHTYLLRS